MSAVAAAAKKKVAERTKRPFAPQTVPARVGRAASGTIRIKREDNGDVTFAWTCGATRTFKPDDMEFTIQNLERTCALGSDIIFADTDSNGRTFYAVLDKGRLYADETIITNLEGRSNVPWPTVRKYLYQACGTKSAKAETKKEYVPPKPVSEEDWRRENE